MEDRGIIYDRLYGEIPVTSGDLQLFQTPELQRLHHVSLSAVPPHFVTAGVTASKFEHSVGAAHLARIVGSKPEFQNIAQDLYFATLIHDVATPPFSHASEYFMVHSMGKNHEEYVADVLDGSELAREIQNQGGDPDRITRFCEGSRHPLAGLVNGSIDIDNLDNSLRYGYSTGILTHKHYDPERIAASFTLHRDCLALAAGCGDELRAWEQVRQQVYRFVYSEANLTPGMMILRALDFAFREGKLAREFYLMNNEQALEYLSKQCRQRTRALMERLNAWKWYSRVFSYTTTHPGSQLVELVKDVRERGRIADELAVQSQIPPEDICVYFGKDKGFKKVDIPMVGDGIVSDYQPLQDALRYLAFVVVHPRWVDKQAVIHEYMSELVG